MALEVFISMCAHGEHYGVMQYRQKSFHFVNEMLILSKFTMSMLLRILRYNVSISN